MPSERAHRLVVLALLLALAAVAMGPVAWPGRALWPWSDSLATALQLDAMHRALLGEGDWTRGALAWPLDGAVTQVDWLGGPALLSLPLHLLGLGALEKHALVCMLGMALGAWACHRVAQALLGPGAHTVVAALVGGFHPLTLGHLPYANLAHGEVKVIGALALGAGLSQRRPGLAALGGLALGGAGWFGFYQAAQAGLVGAILLLVAALARQGDRRSWLAALGGLGLGALSLGPVLQVYMEFQALHGVHIDAQALVAESWDPGIPLRFGEGSTPGGGGAASGGGWSLGSAGVVLGLGLALVGLPSLRRHPGPRWPFLALGLIALGAAALALGPELVWRGRRLGVPGPGRLLALIPGMDGLRAPVRWLGVAWMAMGVLSAHGALRLAARLPRLPAPLVPGLLAGILALLFVRPVASEPQDSLTLQPIYAQVDARPEAGAILDLLPPGGRTDLCACHLGHRLRGAMEHHRPLVGGLYARRVQALLNLNRMTLAWPAPETVELLRRVGVGQVLEHAPRGELQQEGISCQSASGHRLCTLTPLEPPLLAPEDLEVVQAPPVQALRWRRTPKTSGALQITCDGEKLSFPVTMWRTLTLIQRGSEGAALEIQLGRTCARSVEVAGHAPLLLRARDGARPWPTR